MGTVKLDSKPQRISSGVSQPSSSKRSKLPLLKGGSSAQKNRGRSGSIEPPSRVSAALGNFRTPRSKSNTRTPSSNRQPLSNLFHPNSAARNSLTGPKRSSIYGGASHNKENRPITDKEWQKDVVRDLVQFCRENGYQNQALTPKDFYPMNTTTFRYFFMILILLVNTIEPLNSGIFGQLCYCGVFRYFASSRVKYSYFEEPILFSGQFLSFCMDI